MERPDIRLHGGYQGDSEPLSGRWEWELTHRGKGAAGACFLTQSALSGLEDKGMEEKVKEDEKDIRKRKTMGREGGICCWGSVLSPLQLKTPREGQYILLSHTKAKVSDSQKENGC